MLICAYNGDGACNILTHSSCTDSLKGNQIYSYKCQDQPCICHTMRASHTHCTHYADMRAFYEHQSFARTFFPFLRTPALRAVASIAEYWRGPTCSLHAHNTCCMRAIRSLQAFFKLWQPFYRAHIFIRVAYI